MAVCEKCGREYKRQECEFCRREKRWKEYFEEQFLEELNLPPRVLRDLEILEIPQKLIKKVLNILLSGRSVYIWGDVRTGKTLLACKAMLELARENFVENTHWRYAFWKVPVLLQRYIEMLNKKENYIEFSKDVCEVDCLLLDDLGVEKVSDWVLQELYILIDYRYEYLKTTVITSNYSLEELADRLGDPRIPSRIDSMCEKIYLEKVWDKDGQ